MEGLKMDNYNNKTHFYGRLWTVLAIVVLISIPILISAHLGVHPQIKYILSGLAPVAALFYPTAIIEVFTYTPMLGAGATYLSFVTGNITNLKMPCGLNALENNNVSITSDEGEVIATIAVGVSAIVTTVIIAVGVVIFTPILPKITQSEMLAPAFQQVTTALFGALGVSYFMKHWRISIIPIATIILVLIFAGSLGVGVLIPIGVVVSLVSAHLLFKAGKV